MNKSYYNAESNLIAKRLRQLRKERGFSQEELAAQLQLLVISDHYEEIRQALTTGSGSSVRYSDTLTEKTVYEAVRLSDGSVLRIAGSQKTVGMLVLGLLHAVIAVALLAAGLSALLAKSEAKRS